MGAASAVSATSPPGLGAPRAVTGPATFYHRGLGTTSPGTICSYLAAFCEELCTWHTRRNVLVLTTPFLEEAPILARIALHPVSVLSPSTVPVVFDRVWRRGRSPAACGRSPHHGITAFGTLAPTAMHISCASRAWSGAFGSTGETRRKFPDLPAVPLRIHLFAARRLHVHRLAVHDAIPHQGGAPSRTSTRGGQFEDADKACIAAICRFTSAGRLQHRAPVDGRLAPLRPRSLYACWHPAAPRGTPPVLHQARAHPRRRAGSYLMKRPGLEDL